MKRGGATVHTPKYFIGDLNGMSYLWLVRVYVIMPQKPRIIPETDEKWDRKLRVKVGSITCVTIKKGMITPMSNRKTPRTIICNEVTLILLK